MNDIPTELINNEAAFRVWVVQTLTGLTEAKEDAEERIRKIERRIWAASGAIGLLMFLTRSTWTWMK